MPAAYAHRRFGEDVLARLPENAQKIINRHRELFDLGLHGPDLLFYYGPLSSNPVSRQGSERHAAPALEFFRAAGELLRCRDDEALLACCWGFICHFSLDVHCHGYINELAASGGPGHAEAEADFDRALLAESGRELRPKNITGHIRPSGRNARIISEFFPGVTAGQMRLALYGMKAELAFLSTQNRCVRGLVKTALKLSGSYARLGPMLMSSRPNARCAESSRRLRELYTEAVDTALRLIADFQDSARGLRDYDEIYKYNFDSLKE